MGPGVKNVNFKVKTRDFSLQFIETFHSYWQKIKLLKIDREKRREEKLVMLTSVVNCFIILPNTSSTFSTSNRIG